MNGSASSLWHLPHAGLRLSALQLLHLNLSEQDCRNMPISTEKVGLFSVVLYALSSPNCAMRAGLLVARNLRRMRVERGLSQEALAVEAGVDRTYVSRLERGLENPTVGILEKLSTALGLSFAEFFVEAIKGVAPPKPLPGGRKRKAVD